jgi:hypothetical protein
MMSRKVSKNGKQMFLYVLVDPDKNGVYKVGITTNPDQRLRTYRTAAPQSFFSSIYMIPDRKHEKRIFYELSGAFRMDGETVKGPLPIITEGYLRDHSIIPD